MVTNAQNIVSAINDLGFEASIIEDGASSDASIDLQVFIFLSYLFLISLLASKGNNDLLNMIDKNIKGSEKLYKCI